jgi:hypothetical protein
MDKNIVDSVIDRVKNLNKFTITQAVPEGFRFTGEIPYDLKISEGAISVDIWAVSFDEANSKFDQFMEICK